MKHRTLTGRIVCCYWMYLFPIQRSVLPALRLLRLAVERPTSVECLETLTGGQEKKTVVGRAAVRPQSCLLHYSTMFYSAILDFPFSVVGGFCGGDAFRELYEQTVLSKHCGRRYRIADVMCVGVLFLESRHVSLVVYLASTNGLRENTAVMSRSRAQGDGDRLRQADGARGHRRSPEGVHGPQGGAFQAG